MRQARLSIVAHLRDSSASHWEDILAGMKAALPEPQIVTRRGKPVSVIIPIEAYEELLERVEDAADIAWLRRARRKPLQYRSLEAYLASKRTK